MSGTCTAGEAFEFWLMRDLAQVAIVVGFILLVLVPIIVYVERKKP